MSQKKQSEERQHGAAVQQSAVAQWWQGTSATALAGQLGVHRNTIHNWIRAARESARQGIPTPDSAGLRKVEELQLQIEALEGTIGRQAMEIRFFKGALRRVEESRQPKPELGETASTPKLKA